ncbi:hypothetical protein FBEOM_8046 [Fusarium beomiforme]|uniref:Uncharacterized protein n=1 Tax=Fusarium beomiforme TaxID=44412 RepID=A0A9P5AGA8_9HYPO|nr:hypothetical protein FBEOM_8046 [Fusarium beomiforme]
MSRRRSSRAGTPLSSDEDGREKEKKPRNRTTHAEAGFFYDEDVRNKERDSFPPHVESLEQAMLDYKCKEFDLPTKQHVSNIQREAKILAEGEFEERLWEKFFLQFFFIPLERRASVSEQTSRLRKRETYDNSGGDALWGKFNKNHEGTGPLTTPKPDLVFYLPMYHLKPNIPIATAGQAQEGDKATPPSLIESFSWSVIQKLHGHGLLATPFNHLKEKKPLGKHLKCYPWLVIECKTTSSKPAELAKLQEDVYCQAVHASGCAVKLNQNAAKFAVELVSDAQVPPVPTITTVGSEVKVWITFFAKGFLAYSYKKKDRQQFGRQNEGYMMQCIWTGDMTEPDDITKFQLILENTYTWANRVFKQLMATYIHQWRSAFASSISSPSAANTELARRQERMELSRCAFQFIEHSIEAHPNLDGGLHHTVTTRLMDLYDKFVQDVDRIIEQQLAPGNQMASHTMDSQPRRPVSTESTDSTLQSAPRRSGRSKSRNRQQPSGDTGFAVEPVSTRLRGAMSAGAPKRRESQSKYLAPPIEAELESLSESGDSDSCDEENVLSWDPVRRS